MEKDRTLKALLSNKAVFASLINTFIFRQNHFIAPEQILFLAIQGKLQFDHNLHYFDRDVFALVTDSNGKPWFMAGFKNQSAIDPNMDIRNLIYDATAWHWQLTGEALSALVVLALRLMTDEKVSAQEACERLAIQGRLRDHIMPYLVS